MRELKVKKIIKSKKGETLIESIASILVFAILMLTVAAIIGTSIKMTQNANAKTSAWQEKSLNTAVEEKYKTESEERIKMAFKRSSTKLQNEPYSVESGIIVNDGEVFSFYPVE